MRTICEKQHDWLRRVAFTLLAVLALGCQAQADGFTVNASGISCDEPFASVPCGIPATINAFFTTSETTGTFFLLAFDETFQGTEPLVTDITGTFNGQPMSFVAPLQTNPYGMVGWMIQGLPQNVSFEAGGTTYLLNWDGDGAPEIFFLEERLNWSATAPTSIPEPAEWIMLLTGLDALLIAGWLRRRRARA